MCFWDDTSWYLPWYLRSGEIVNSTHHYICPFLLAGTIIASVKTSQSFSNKLYIVIVHKLVLSSLSTSKNFSFLFDWVNVSVTRVIRDTNQMCKNVHILNYSPLLSTMSPSFLKQSLINFSILAPHPRHQHRYWYPRPHPKPPQQPWYCHQHLHWWRQSLLVTHMLWRCCWRFIIARTTTAFILW